MSYDTNDTHNDMLSFSPPQSQPHKIEFCFEQLRSEILSMLANEALHVKNFQKLEAELNVYKRAYNGLESEKIRLEKLKRDAVKDKEDLENQIKGFRVVTLLDGDGTIFTGDLIVQGKAGGHAAARKLSDSIMQYLTSTFGSNQYQLWVYIFFNKRGLADTFGRAGNPMARAKFDDFVVGFNQAAERFLMVDVGDAKEAADAKIKARLEDELRFPQTYKIIFGGCHDNGYVTNLRSQITAGFKHKLILLQGYVDMAAGMLDLELPVLSVPDLFLASKLVSLYPAQGATPPASHGEPPSRICSTQFTTPIPLTLAEVDQNKTGALPETTLDTKGYTTSRSSSVPTSYSSAVQAKQMRIPTPDLDSSSSTASEASDDPPEHPFPTFRGSRHVNPNIPLSKHKPPPCTLFYLANCKHGTDCKYGHDYLLDAEHFAEIRLNAKRAPCPAINKGEPCLWGDECCYGHYCSLFTKCHFFKQGRCKFVGADMHKEPKTCAD